MKDDTVEKMKIMQAYVDGKKIEMRRAGEEWVSMPDNLSPLWNYESIEYRIAPEPIEVWIETCNNGKIPTFPNVYSTKEQGSRDLARKNTMTHVRKFVEVKEND